MRTLLIILGILVAGSTFANPRCTNKVHCTKHVVVKQTKSVKRNVWIPGHWVKSRRGKTWVKGHWSKVSNK